MKTQLLIITALFCQLAAAAPSPAWVGRLLNPDVPLTSFSQTQPRPNETRRFGWVRVDASGMSESVYLGTPRLKGTHLEIGAVLGFLRVGQLHGVLEHTFHRPGLKKVYGVRVPALVRVTNPTVFVAHKVGVRVVSKRAMRIPLPRVLHVRASQIGNKLKYQIVNRRALELHVSRQIDRLLSDRLASHYFTFHLMNPRTILQPALDKMFGYFQSQILAELRSQTKKRILNSGFIDEILQRSRELVPSVQLEPGKSVDAYLTQNIRGTNRTWNLALCPDGKAPSPDFFKDWPLPPTPKTNQLQIGVSGAGLLGLARLVLANTDRLKSHIPGLPFPPELEVDSQSRALVLTPPSHIEAQGIRALFDSLVPNQELPRDGVVEVTFPGKRAAFSRTTEGMELVLRVHLALVGKTERTKPIPLDLTFSLDKKVQLELVGVRLRVKQTNAVQKRFKQALQELGPGIQSLLLQAVINQKIEDAYDRLPQGTQLEKFVRTGPIHPNAEATGLSITVLSPLAFPVPE